MEKRHLMTIGIIVGILVILAVLVGVLLLTQNQAVSETAQVYFVGTEDDADCTIITSGEQCLMIDTGEQQDAPHILEVLEELGIGK